MCIRDSPHTLRAVDYSLLLTFVAFFIFIGNLEMCIRDRLWTHASARLQGSAQLEWRELLTNVNLMAIAAGALLYLLHISLPAPITSTLSLSLIHI